MSGSQRALKQRIKSTETLKKIFRAMEMIAASRVGKARAGAESITTYDSAIAAAVAAVSAHAKLDHPLITERTDTNRVAVLAVTSDRGMAGAYSASILRETERLLERLRDEGKDPVVYVSGRRGLSYFNFRGTEVRRAWTGDSDKPSEERTMEIAKTLLAAFLKSPEEGGVCELYMVYTKFRSMVSQVPQVRKMLPIKVIDPDEAIQIDGMGLGEVDDKSVMPLYDFEPSAEEVLQTVMPLYVESRIRTALLHAAAAELASRQNAMHAATDNASNLINTLTLDMNKARQADITTEITEIVSGADALQDSKK